MSLSIKKSDSPELRAAKESLPEEAYAIMEQDGDSDAYPIFWGDVEDLDDYAGQIVGVYKLTGFRKVHRVRRTSLREAV